MKWLAAFLLAAGVELAFDSGVVRGQTLHIGAFVGVATAEAPASAERNADEPLIFKVSSASVRDAQNLQFGRIEHLVVNPSTGNIEYALVVNTVITNTARVTPIPWRLLTNRTPVSRAAPGINQVLQINEERNKLMKAPYFERYQWPDMSKKDWADPYNAYFKKQAD
jgi:hypothetical protein